MNRIETLALISFIALVIILVGLFLFATPTAQYSQRYVRELCLKNGYPSYQIYGDAYCIKRENGTDIVVNIEDIKE